MPKYPLNIPGSTAAIGYRQAVRLWHPERFELFTYLSHQILETAPGQPGVLGLESLVQVGGQQVQAHVEVGLVEVVRHVQTDPAVFPALL